MSGRAKPEPPAGSDTGRTLPKDGALVIRCPKCRQQPGRECINRISPSGGSYVILDVAHPERIAAAMKAKAPSASGARGGASGLNSKLRGPSSLNPKGDADPAGIVALHAECVRAVRWWNARYWGGSLPEPVVTFQPNAPNGSRLGHFQAKTWVQEGTGVRDELVLYSDLCLKRGIKQVLQTIAHELVHCWEEHLPFPPKTAHHGKRWHREAARIGLKTEGPKGTTSPTPQFEADVKAFAPTLKETAWRRPDIGAGVTKLRKWVCDCGFGVRVAVPYFNAKCLTCGEKYALDE